MENTCTFPDCKFWKTFSDNPEECPHFRYTQWESGDKKEIKRFKDCAPTKTMIMVQDLYNRLIGVQQAQEQQRNNVDRLANLTCTVVERMTEYPSWQDISSIFHGLKPIPNINHTMGMGGSLTYERPDNTGTTVSDNRGIDGRKQDTESGDSQITGRDQEGES